MPICMCKTGQSGRLMTGSAPQVELGDFLSDELLLQQPSCISLVPVIYVALFHVKAVDYQQEK